jgi:hypothetical protein
MNCIDRDIEAILDVIAVVSNPSRSERRYSLFNNFCKSMLLQKKVRLTTVELQQGERPFMTNATIKKRTDDELWHKENLINIGINSLPDDAKYIAWIDADIDFQNTDWVNETIHQLQTYDIVQLFQHAIDLGPTGETMNVHTSFCSLYRNGEPMNNYTKSKSYKNGHTGYAFAATRSALDNIGGLMDYAILGSADAHMCLAFIGEVSKSLNKGLHSNYKMLTLIFQDRCDKYIKKNIGYVNGTILHHWHGEKTNRQYSSRWEILIGNNYDPLRDIKKDCNGVWQLEDAKIKLRDDIIKYFRTRLDDANIMTIDTLFTKAKWF